MEDVTHPLSLMSPHAVLAHEYYGHAANKGTPAPARMWNDEFRACYMAAKNAPNLTEMDRYQLIQDAITRAQEAGVKIELNDFMRSILFMDIKKNFNQITIDESNVLIKASEDFAKEGKTLLNCPRCGSKLIYEKFENSSVIRCEQENCLKLTFRGL